MRLDNGGVLQDSARDKGEVYLNLSVQLVSSLVLVCSFGYRHMWVSFLTVMQMPVLNVIKLQIYNKNGGTG